MIYSRYDEVNMWIILFKLLLTFIVIVHLGVDVVLYSFQKRKLLGYEKFALAFTIFLAIGGIWW